ncbi:MAG: N-acetyltransferase [Bacteroidota bacterium]
MNSTLTIKKVSKKDLPSIFRLEEEAFAPMHYPLFVLRQLFDIAPDLFLVAVDALDQIKGYCFGTIDQDHQTGWIFALAVVKEEQRKKIGAQLTSRLLDVFSSKKINNIQLTTTPDNEAAIQLYEKLGFEKVDEEADYYFDGTPRIIMKLNMDDPRKNTHST